MNSPRSVTGRVLGIDPGERRVGIAISDPGRILATGVSTLDAREWDHLLTALLEIIDREGIQMIVIGYPLTLKGEKGKLTEQADRLSQVFTDRDLQVVLWDERFSSKAAKRILIQQGVKTGHHKDDVNRKAAEWILQSYLDSL